MSHELRTPLNSLLILSDQLSKNPDGNLTAKQTEFAKTIHSSGNDLLMLINDILDLSKIESGTVVVDVGELRFDDLHNYVERTFRHVAEAKGVDFVDRARSEAADVDSHRRQAACSRSSRTCSPTRSSSRIAARCRFSVDIAEQGWSSRQRQPQPSAQSVLAFSVSDTGIGIPPDKQQIIFEAFQQADGSTSRKYGGTGLGLAISREIARLLGGEIGLVSDARRGQHVHAVPAAEFRAAIATAPGAAGAQRRSTQACRHRPKSPDASMSPTKWATIATRSSPATACC